MAEILESSLKRLGFSYIKNQGRNVTEFEVRSPCRFIASVESVTGQKLSFLIPRSGVLESAVELRRLIGSNESEASLSACVSALVRELRSALPEEPWKGTGLLKSKGERANWESLGDL